MTQEIDNNEKKAERHLRIKEFGEGFSGYEKSLRTWFVAYGIGGLVVFLTQPWLRGKLVDDANSKWIAIFFLSGVAIQVLESILYKAITWYPYYRELENNPCDRRKYRISKWVHKNYWIDFILDLLTLMAFAIATILAYPIIMNKP